MVSKILHGPNFQHTKTDDDLKQVWVQFCCILGYVSDNNGLLNIESGGFISSRVVGHPLLYIHGWRHTKCVLRKKKTCKTIMRWSSYGKTTDPNISLSQTDFACVSSRSALLLAAVLSPRSLSVPLSAVSLLWERFTLWMGQGLCFRALVERGRGTGRRLQEPTDGRMVQHCRVTFQGVLEKCRENMINLCNTKLFSHFAV